MNARWLLVLGALAIACEPSATQPSAPAPPDPSPTPIEPVPPAPVEPAPPAPAADATAPTFGEGPSMCVQMCERQGQARAVAADVVRRDCEARCEAGPTAASACIAAAAEARTTVESVPMPRRAPKVWAVVGNADLTCGYSDPFTRALARAATKDLVARRVALTAALDADPFAGETCPAGTRPNVEGATAADAITACGLDDPPQGWHGDVGALTFLAIRAVRLRYAALGLDQGDHARLLDIVTLASALERE